MAMIGEIQFDVRAIRELLEDGDDGEAEVPKLTTEDHERFERVQAMVRERIAYHEAKAREDERRAQGGGR